MPIPGHCKNEPPLLGTVLAIDRHVLDDAVCSVTRIVQYESMNIVEQPLSGQV